MKRCLSFENIPKSLECSFPVFLLSKWLRFEFCRSEIHFLRRPCPDGLSHPHEPGKWPRGFVESSRKRKGK